ncbi:MAG: PucR family transcriptional regulator [Lachnospiraceae bacterium]|nr:PucR family transcriptional regulator [Lachnospiraceae bacterium]MCI8996312.1 PucR family transcriptional regulator [Lachnospiraceae bacterium]MCI9133361.1 PucR family transcriptional regulator [Lachnospiraceae bacterium]
MKLSKQLLYDRLSESYTITAFGSMDGQTELGSPLFYEKGTEFQRGHVYLLDHWEEDLPVDSTSLFVVCESQAEPGGRTANSFFVIRDPVSSISLYNKILKIYSIYDEWKEETIRLSMEDGTLEEMLTATYEVLGNPLLLLTADFQVVGEVGMDSLPSEKQLFRMNTGSIEVINALKQDPLYNEMQERKEPFLFPDQLMGVRFWNMNIRRYERTTHRLLLLEGERPLKGADAYVLSIFSKTLPHVLFHSQEQPGVQERPLQEALERAVSDRSADYMRISQQLLTAGWNTGHHYLCLVLQITYLDQKNLTIPAICRYVEALLPDSCAFPFKEDIVVFLNLTRLNLDEEEASRKLTVFIRDSFLKAGYSRAMKNHWNLRRQYEQAVIALHLGNEKKPYLWIYHFNDLALPYMLSQVTRQLPSYMLCHEKLLKLKELDLAQNTEYVKTLGVYLDNHLNAVQSAKALFIHRSTLLYRLEKIQNILETRFEDPDEILYLMLSFRLMDHGGNV